MTRGSSRGSATSTTLKLVGALVVTVATAEVALHLAPSILPGWYRQSFPLHGVELFHPGLLDRTPIEGVPLPLVVEAYSGPPTSDLKESGVVPLDEDSDARRFPRIFIPADAQGFPNTEVVEETDVLLVGDSFAVACGVLEPPGLQTRLAAATGLGVYNIGVSAMGPVREEWLLENVGLAKKPRCVVWFFFSGNDAIGSALPLVEKRKGNETWGAVHADNRPPVLILPDLVRKALSARPAPSGDPYPGFPFALADGTIQPLWFNPFHLRLLELTREDWEDNNGWNHARRVITRARATAEEAGVRFLLVYIPTKAEVYLPHVEVELELFHRVMSHGLAELTDEDPAAMLRSLLERRGSLEATVQAFTAAAGIPFVSATGPLERLAASGELGYLVADTHWQSTGQSALLPDLLAWLESEGFLPQ